MTSDAAANVHDLRVASLSLDIVPAEKKANLSAAIAAIRSLPGDVDLAVIPELFTTGFVASHDEALDLAEENSGTTISVLRDLAAELSLAICGSHLAKNPGSDAVYNRVFFITPDGETTFYDKHHLFILGEEAKVYTPGTEIPPVIEFQGWHISMVCCYDLRFPCWMRNRDLRYDVMIVPANWPDARAFAWNHLLIARAIENQAYYVGANRGGSDEYGTYDGLSQILNYNGKPIAAPFADGAAKCEVLLADLSYAKLQIQRRAFPAWRSAD